MEALFVRRAALAAALVMLAGCGGGGAKTTTTTPNAASTKDRAAVLKTVNDIYDAFTRAEGERLCGLMAPAPRQQLLAVIDAAFPRLKNKSCGNAMLGFYRQVPPSEAPRAMDQAQAIAGDLSYKKVRVNGDEATIRFPDGGTWALTRMGGGWRVSRFPMLPKGALGPGDSPPPALS